MTYTIHHDFYRMLIQYKYSFSENPGRSFDIREIELAEHKVITSGFGKH